MDKEKKEKGDIICDGCGHSFATGEKMYLLRIHIYSRDYCTNCKDKIIAFLNTLTPDTMSAAISIE